MNEDDSESIASENTPSKNENHTSEKTCVESMDDDTSNKPSAVGDLNQSNDSAIENDAHDRTDTSLNSTVNSKPSTSGKSRRRSGAKKHRAGRNRKRKWKPYHKLTWEEKQRLDERNARRAQRVRDELSAGGLPLAPYNTSQFLINDYLSCHVIKTPNYDDMAYDTNHNHSDDHHNHSDDSFEEHYHSNSDQSAFYEQAFLEDYELVHEEYLNNLSPYDLVDEWMNLEDKIEAVEKQLKEVQEQKRRLGIDTSHLDAEMEKIEVFRVEIEKLFEENQDLEAKNEKLCRRLLNMDS